MKAVIHELFSPDTDDLEAFQPSGPAFTVLVQALIGPDPGRGEESFDFVVCSPAWIRDRARESGCFVPRHHIVVEPYRFSTVRDAIERICSEAVGDDWTTLATYIARFGHWEFEDYRPA